MSDSELLDLQGPPSDDLAEPEYDYEMTNEMNEQELSIPKSIVDRLVSVTKLPDHAYARALQQLNNPYVVELLVKLDRFLQNDQVKETISIHELNAQVLTLNEQLSATIQNASTEKSNFETKLEVSAKQLLESQSQIANLKTDLEKSQEEKEKLHNKVQELETHFNSAKTEFGQKDQDTKSLLLLLERRQQDVDRLNQEVTFLREQLDESRKESSELNTKISMIESSSNTRNFLLESKEQELIQTKQHIEWLTGEMNKQQEEARVYKLESQKQIFDSQSENRLLTSKLESSESQMNLSSKKLGELEAKLNEVSEQKNKQEQDFVVTEHSFQQEMTKLKKLSELYSTQCQDLNKRNSELEKMLSEMTSQLEEFKFNRDLRYKQVESQLFDCSKVIKEQKERISSLENEIQVANAELGKRAQVEEIGTLSETALVATRVQKSGKTFSQVYSEYAALKEQIIELKAENGRLQECLQQILGELNEKAPVIQQLRTEHEQLKSEITRKTRESLELNDRNEQLESNRTELQAQLNILSRENRVLLQETKDLGRQVQALLRELQEFRGSSLSAVTAIRQKDTTMNTLVDSEKPESEAETLINERLVVFHSIQEMQQQNQQMRRTLRLMTEKIEDLERNNQLIPEYEEQTKKATVFIKELQSQNESLDQKYQLVLRERDQYKKVAESKETQVLVVDTKNFDELSQEFEEYKRQTAVNFEMHRAETDKLTVENKSLNLKIVNLTSQLHNQLDRYTSLADNYNTQCNEYQQLQNRLYNLTDSLNSQAHSNQQLLQQLLETKQQLLNEQQQTRQFTSQIHVMEQNEQRLVKDIEILVAEKTKVNEMMRELRKWQQDVDFRHQEENRGLREKLERDERELVLARQQLNDYVQEIKTLSQKQHLDTKSASLVSEKLKEELFNVKQELAASKSREEELKRQVETKQQPLVIPVSTSQSDTDIQLSKLSCQLALEREKCSTFEAISKANEQSLQEMTSSYDLYKEQMEKEAALMNAKVADLEQKSTELEANLKQSIDQVALLQQQLDEADGKAQVARAELAANVEHLKQALEQASAETVKAKQDLARQEQLVTSSQHNYEREILAHSKNIQLLNELRKTVEQLTGLNTNLEQELAEKSQLLSKTSAQLTSLESVQQSEIGQLKQRLTAALEQNELLNSMLKQSTNNELGSTDSKFQQVVEYLKKEQQILTTQNELFIQENTRLKHQLNQLQKKLQETKLALEMKPAEPAVDNSQLLNQMNLLTESNQTLRQQTVADSTKIQQLNQKLSELANELEPYKHQITSIQVELEMKQQEIKNLEADNERWKKRTLQILSKYERIDPVEHEQIKQQLERSKAEMTNLNKTLAEKTIMIDQLKTQLDSKVLKSQEQSKNTAIQQLEQQRDLLIQEKQQFQAEIDRLKEKITRNVTSYKTNTAKLTQKTSELEQQVQQLLATQNESADQVEMRYKVKLSLLEAQVQKLKGTAATAPATPSSTKRQVEQVDELETKKVKLEHPPIEQEQVEPAIVDEEMVEAALQSPIKQVVEQVIHEAVQEIQEPREAEIVEQETVQDTTTLEEPVEEAQVEPDEEAEVPTEEAETTEEAEPTLEAETTEPIQEPVKAEPEPVKESSIEKKINLDKTALLRQRIEAMKAAAASKEKKKIQKPTKEADKLAPKPIQFEEPKTKPKKMKPKGKKPN